MPDPVDPKKPEGENQPKPLYEEDVGKIVNAAVTSHNGRMQKALEASFAAKLEEFKTEFSKQFAAPAPKSDKGGDEGGGKPGTKSELERQIQSLAEKLEASEKARQAEAQRASEIEQQSKFSSAKNAFRSAVAAKVRPELLDPFIELYAGPYGRLKVSEDGKPILTVKRAPYKGAPEQDEDLSLEEAVPVLLASKDVSPFLPAPGGQQGGNGIPQQRTQLPAYQLAAQDQSDMAKLHAVGEALKAAGLPEDVL